MIAGGTQWSLMNAIYSEKDLLQLVYLSVQHCSLLYFRKTLGNIFFFFFSIFIFFYFLFFFWIIFFLFFIF